MVLGWNTIIIADVSHFFFCEPFAQQSIKQILVYYLFTLSWSYLIKRRPRGSLTFACHHTFWKRITGKVQNSYNNF